MFNRLLLGLKYPVSKELFEKTNYQIETMSKVAFFVMVKLSVPGFILPKAFVSYFKYLTTDLGPNAFDLSIPAWYDVFSWIKCFEKKRNFVLKEFVSFFHFRYPFDWKNPIRYLFAVALQLVQTFNALHYVACFLTFAIGSAIISLSVAKEIKGDLILIDQRAKSGQSKQQMVEHFGEIIRFTNLRKLDTNVIYLW